MGAGLFALLSKADIGLGRLDGVVKVIPDPTSSSRCTSGARLSSARRSREPRAHLRTFLRSNWSQGAETAAGSDVGDIVNYVRAMNYGLGRLHDLPLSLRLIREIHGELMWGGRGAQAPPGAFRTSENWIGPPGAPLSRATFVPPLRPR